jgi:YHS domain-containing protein
MSIPALYRWLVIAAALLALGGCATRNALPDGAGGKAILAGYDPVSYHQGPTPVRGDPKINTQWDAGTYYFANAANRDLFMKNPDRYAPAYGGFCANGAPYSVMLGGGPDAYKIVDGRSYFFSGPGSLATWAMDEKRNIELGDQYWKTEMKDVSSAWLHSWWRVLVAKVPHYKTGKELNAELAARQGKKN